MYILSCVIFFLSFRVISLQTHRTPALSAVILWKSLAIYSMSPVTSPDIMIKAHTHAGFRLPCCSLHCSCDGNTTAQVPLAQEGDQVENSGLPTINNLDCKKLNSILLRRDAARRLNQSGMTAGAVILKWQAVIMWRSGKAAS